MIRKFRVAQKNIAGKLLLGALIFLLVQGSMKSYQLLKQEPTSGQASLGNIMLEVFAGGITEVLYGQFVPAYAMQIEGEQGNYQLLGRQIGSLLPLYEYMVNEMTREQMSTIVLTEVEENEDDTVTLTLEELLEAENLMALSDGEGKAEGGELVYEGDADLNFGPEAIAGNSTENLLEVPDEMVAEQSLPLANFIPHTMQAQVDLAPLSDYEVLLQQFYTVDANTSASSERLNVEKFLAQDLTISKEAEGPQILIFHTHASEGFADSVAGDVSTTIVGAGERLAHILQETYGYEVMHHLGRYDETRDDAYGEALPEIQKLLKDNPSIKVVIDLHRDEMPQGTKLVMDLDGRPTARFMFFNGLSRTKKTGNISYLKNENLDANLAFSFQMQKKAMEYYPGLTRKIYLKGYRYNMHLKDKYLLVELGAQNNTVEEAMNACDPLSHILDLVLSGE